MRRFLKEEWLQILILLVPLLVVACTWNEFGDRVPIHWNFKGRANGYSSKALGLLLLPLINIGVAVLLGSLGKLDPKVYQMNLPSSGMKPIRLAITGFLFVIYSLTTLAPVLGLELNIGTTMQLAIPLLFLVLGNFLPTVKPNYFVGVRTPWTLASDENWRATHAFTGRLWVIASAIYFLLQFFLPNSVRPILFGIYLGVLIVPPLAFSFLLFQKSKRA